MHKVILGHLNGLSHFQIRQMREHQVFVKSIGVVEIEVRNVLVCNKLGGAVVVVLRNKDEVADTFRDFPDNSCLFPIPSLR